MPLNNVCDRLGPDAGQLTNSKKWKRATPSSFSSPYITQADIGKYSVYATLLKFRYQYFLFQDFSHIKIRNMVSFTVLLIHSTGKYLRLQYLIQKQPL